METRRNPNFKKDHVWTARTPMNIYHHREFKPQLVGSDNRVHKVSRKAAAAA